MQLRCPRQPAQHMPCPHCTTGALIVPTHAVPSLYHWCPHCTNTCRALIVPLVPSLYQHMPCPHCTTGALIVPTHAVPSLYHWPTHFLVLSTSSGPAGYRQQLCTPSVSLVHGPAVTDSLQSLLTACSLSLCSHCLQPSVRPAVTDSPQSDMQSLTAFSPACSHC